MDQRRSLIQEIVQLAYDTEELNLNNRTGITGYIDFIDIKEITSPVMRGTDTFHRPFITVCAEIEYADGITVPTFTTFFKRYTENSSLLWHACGFYHKLMETSGGMNIPQFVCLRDLLKNGVVVFEDGRDDESIENIRLVNYSKTEEGKIVSSYWYKRPLKISLAMSPIDTY